MEQRSPTDTPDVPPSVALFRMVTSFWVPPAIHVVAVLGIADLLADGPRGCDELAQATNTDALSLGRVLRALAGVGLFIEDDGGRFGLTPLSTCLRRDVPSSVRPAALLFGIPAQWDPWSDLLHSVRTGQPAFEHRFGMGVFDYYAQHPEAAALFNQFMAAGNAGQHAAVAAAYDFSRLTRLVDVGGGNGALLAAILSAYPHLRGILFDRAEVVAGAPAILMAAGVADRCEVVGGDFFEALPSGGDAHIVSRILHDWDDDRAVEILRTCRRALPEHGTLLVVEQVLPPRELPPPAAFIDLAMLVIAGGRERTEAEYDALFDAAGFRLTRTIPTTSPYSIIEGVAI